MDLHFLSPMSGYQLLNPLGSFSSKFWKRVKYSQKNHESYRFTNFYVINSGKKKL
ncbi:hypothetical protein BH11VER1_BH11VER1_33980 [soil metagenome]